ncbi:MAG: hypothetical protein JRI77_17880, partial [Deltaproteobacteria bacterium]|nr:hypothetical protein [Deltaproteobacteria bacterium]
MIKKFSVCVFAILLAATTASNWALAAAEPVENQVLYYASAGRDIRSMDPAFATSSVELFM